MYQMMTIINLLPFPPSDILAMMSDSVFLLSPVQEVEQCGFVANAINVLDHQLNIG
jgi:hypothetical protein